jgi:hypothetical protein
VLHLAGVDCCRCFDKKTNAQPPSNVTHTSLHSISTKCVALAFYNLFETICLGPPEPLNFGNTNVGIMIKMAATIVDGEESKIGEFPLRWMCEVFPYFTFFPIVRPTLKDLTDDALLFV